MSGKGESRFTVRALPARLGLATAGQQAAIDEGALWKCTNFGSDADGLLSKRPGIRAYGQAIQAPDAGATGSTATAFLPLIDGIAGLIDTDATAGDISYTAARGTLQVNTPKGTPGSTTRSLAYAASALPAGLEWAFRARVRVVGASAYNGTDTAPGAFVIRAQAAATVAAEFAVFSGGLYYKAVTTGRYTLIAGTEFVGFGGWNTIELRRDGSGVLVYLNDAYVTAIAASAMYVPTLAGTSLFELVWDYGVDSAYTTYVVTPMYNDTPDDPFVGQPVNAIGQFQYDASTGGIRRELLIAAGDYIYHDTNLSETWRPLYARRYLYTHFAPYRQSVVWTDYDGAGQSVLWQWNGGNAVPVHLTDAPPVEVVVEHQGKLWGIRDHSNPHRVYYTPYAQPNKWFAPSPDSTETFDTALDAGYIQVPAKGGDRVTAIFGDYYGSVILWTRKTVSKVDGFGVLSYQHAFLSQETGCEDQHAVVQVGNDLWFGGRQGMRSLVATQQYGDLQVQQPMMVLQNLWAPFVRSELNVNRGALANSITDYNPSTGLVLVALPLYGSQVADSVFAYNALTQQCHGPWDLDGMYAMRNVECLSPLREVVLCGYDDGRVGYMDYSWKVDFGSTQCTGTLESAVIDGRSLGPDLQKQVKTFKTLRLHLVLRGHWDFTVNWTTYGQESGDFQTDTANQNLVRRAYVVDRDMRVDVKPDGAVLSGEEVVQLEIPLDARGQGLVWQINSTNELAVHGWEVEFLAVGAEQE